MNTYISKFWPLLHITRHCGNCMYVVQARGIPPSHDDDDDDGNNNNGTIKILQLRCPTSFSQCEYASRTGIQRNSLQEYGLGDRI